MALGPSQTKRQARGNHGRETEAPVSSHVAQASLGVGIPRVGFRQGGVDVGPAQTECWPGLGVDSTATPWSLTTTVRQREGERAQRWQIHLNALRLEVQTRVESLSGRGHRQTEVRKPMLCRELSRRVSLSGSEASLLRLRSHQNLIPPSHEHVTKYSPTRFKRSASARGGPGAESASLEQDELNNPRTGWPHHPRWSPRSRVSMASLRSLSCNLNRLGLALSARDSQSRARTPWQAASGIHEA
eukprot:3681799-Rhodomonas_salina.1